MAERYECLVESAVLAESRLGGRRRVLIQFLVRVARYYNTGAQEKETGEHERALTDKPKV